MIMHVIWFSAVNGNETAGNTPVSVEKCSIWTKCLCRKFRSDSIELFCQCLQPKAHYAIIVIPSEALKDMYSLECNFWHVYIVKKYSV